MLRDPSVASRNEASTLLGQLGPAAQEAIPDLELLLNDLRNPAPAGFALGRIGGDGIPVLIKALDSPHEFVVTAAAHGLTLAGPAAKDAVPRLVRLATDTRSTQLRSVARMALAQIGAPAVAELTKELAAADAGRRRGAAEMFLLYGGVSDAALAALEKAAGDENLSVRVTAARAAFHAGSRAKPVIKALLDGFKAQDALLRQGTAFTVASAWPIPLELFAAAKEALNDTDGYVKVYAAHTLAHAKETAPAAATVLIDALRDTSLRIPAAHVLASPDIQHSAMKGALPALQSLLKDPSAQSHLGLRAAVAFALARIGGADVVDALLDVVPTYSPGPRNRFAEALGETGPAGVAALQKLLIHPTRNLQLAVADILGPKSATDPKVVAELIAHLDSPDAGLRARLVAALRWAGPNTKDAVSAATRLLRDPDLTVRIEAATTVAILGDKEGRAEALAILRAALKDSDAIALLPLTMRGLGLLGPAAAEAVPDLLALLTRHNPEVRASAAEALGRIGKAAKPAVATLTKMIDDPDPRVKAHAAVALWRITGDAKPSVPALSAALADPVLVLAFEDPRLTSNYALRPDVPGPLPPVEANLIGPWDTTPVCVIRALGEIGPDAKPAADALRYAERDSDPTIRAAATEALKKINAKP